MFMQQKYKLTNLELSHLGGKHIQDDGQRATVGVLRDNDQLDLPAGVETSHREVGLDTCHVGQDDHGHTVHHLQDKTLLETSIKPWDTLHLQQLRGLGQGGQIFLYRSSNCFQSAACILTLKFFKTQL